MEELKPMTNKEAADFLKKMCLNVQFGRGNGKSMTVLRYTEAMMKAIHLLETTPDEE